MSATLSIMQGDVLSRLVELPDASIQCCITSPPYWGLRDYGVEGQIGLEETPDAYVAKLVKVFHEVRRVLRDDGTLWLNLGDSYAAERGGTHQPAETLAGGCGGYMLDGSRVNRDRNDGYSPSRNAKAIGLKHKDLVGIPWRVAFALQADGWWLRQEIIWAKGISGEACAFGWHGSSMPESVLDRCTKAHEHIFLFSKSPRYFFDSFAIRDPAAQPKRSRADKMGGNKYVAGVKHSDGSVFTGSATRNRRDVWTISPKPYREAHFAVFPEALVEPMVLAGTSAEGCCSVCGAPWKRKLRVVDRFVWEGGGLVPREKSLSNNTYKGLGSSSMLTDGCVGRKEEVGWEPTCACGESAVPCCVLDPFAGSGTTGAVSLRLGRRAVLIELNDKYLPLIEKRCAKFVNSSESR